jgi:hypothetical protein
MTFAKLTTVLSFTAALAAATPVLATTNTNVDDSHGVNSIGIDIRGAGGSPQAIQAFLSKLSPETVRGVVAGCQNAVNNPNTYPQDVQSFCVGVNQIGGSVQPSALGFAAPAKAPLFAPMMNRAAPTQPNTNWTGGSPGGSGPAY